MKVILYMAISANGYIAKEDDDPLDAATKEFLDKNYPNFENESFIWYKIN